MKQVLHVDCRRLVNRSAVGAESSERRDSEHYTASRKEHHSQQHRTTNKTNNHKRRPAITTNNRNIHIRRQISTTSQQPTTTNNNKQPVTNNRSTQITPVAIFAQAAHVCPSSRGHIQWPPWTWIGAAPSPPRVCRYANAQQHRPTPGLTSA